MAKIEETRTFVRAYAEVIELARNVDTLRALYQRAVVATIETSLLHPLREALLNEEARLARSLVDLRASARTSEQPGHGGRDRRYLVVDAQRKVVDAYFTNAPPPNAFAVVIDLDTGVYSYPRDGDFYSAQIRTLTRKEPA